MPCTSSLPRNLQRAANLTDTAISYSCSTSFPSARTFYPLLYLAQPKNATVRIKASKVVWMVYRHFIDVGTP